MLEPVQVCRLDPQDAVPLFSHDCRGSRARRRQMEVRRGTGRSSVASLCHVTRFAHDSAMLRESAGESKRRVGALTHCLCVCACMIEKRVGRYNDLEYMFF